MHELGIVFHIIRTVEDVAKQNDVTRIRRVTLQLGEVSGVVESYLQDCWKWAAAKTDLLPGAVLAESASPPVAAMSTFTNAGALLIVVGGICACISTSNGLMMSGSRIPFAMGRDGDLPRAMESVNRQGVPKGALILTMIGQLAICLSGSMIYVLVSLSVCATIVSWVITTVCAIVLRMRKVKTPFRAPGYPVTPVLAILGLVFMFTRLAQQAIIMTVIWAIGGIVVYFLFNKTSLKNTCNPKAPVPEDGAAPPAP